MITLELKSVRCINESTTDDNGEYVGQIEAIYNIVGDTTIEMKKLFDVISNNSQTGTEVDIQRQNVALEYINNLTN